MTSSHPVPSSEAPRICLLSASASTFMNPAVSPFSTARPTRGHRARRDQGGLAAVPYLGLGHSRSAEGWIDIERIGGNAVADPARAAVEEVCRDDLEIIIGGVGEGAFAVAVTERPHPRHVRAQLIVDDDVASLVPGDPGFVEPEIVGVRPTADREQQV